jgi:hypothetical protein
MNFGERISIVKRIGKFFLMFKRYNFMDPMELEAFWKKELFDYVKKWRILSKNARNISVKAFVNYDSLIL